ncbi:MAG: hypothetical protein WA005_14695 [Candidatus Binataceae bacterium]
MKKFYPESWLQFIKSTLMPEPGESSGSYSMHSSFANIVEFLILMGRVDESRKVIDAAISAALERVADLPLTKPEWLPGDDRV